MWPDELNLFALLLHLVDCLNPFCGYYHKIPDTGIFIKKRYLFCSPFWGMKSSNNMVLESWQKHSLAVSQQIKWHDVVEVYSRGRKEARMGVWCPLL